MPAAQPALHMHGAGEAVLNQIKEESLYYINTAGIFSETINEYLPQRGTGTVALFIHPDNISIVEAEFSLPVLIKLLPTILSITGAILAIFLYNKNINFVVKLTEIPFFSKLYTFLNSKYYFDVIYNNYIITKGFKLGYKVSEELDKGVIELVGPYGLSNLLSETAKNIAKLDTGLIPSYIIYIISGFMFLILFTFAPLILNYSYHSAHDSILLLILYIPTLYFTLNFSKLSISSFRKWPLFKLFFK